MNRRLTLSIGAAAALAMGAAGVSLLPAVAAQTNRERPFAELRSLLAPGPELGVSVRDVTEADVTSAKLDGRAGAYVATVRADSPAAKAGVQAGDVILNFDGERVRSASHLVRLVSETAAGSPVEIVIHRAGSRRTLSATPEEGARLDAPRVIRAPGLRPDLFERFELERENPGTRGVAGRLGASVQDLTPQLGAYFGAAGGVLVTSVDSGTPAATAGLRAGDVITRVGDTTVRTVADVRRAVAAASGDVRFSIVREKALRTMMVRLPARGSGSAGPTI